MRKYNQEITDTSIITKLLTSAKICRLAMINNNTSYLLPFNFGYADNNIYIHTAPEGRKIDILKENPNVCFEVESDTELFRGEKACNWSTKYRSIIGHGIVEFIEKFEEKKKALDVIMIQHGRKDNLDYSEKNINAVAILKITIKSMTAKQSSNWDKIEKANPKPNDCKNMDEIRNGIDKIDNQIVKMLAERSKYVYNAAKFKTSEKGVRDTERVNKVISHKIKLAKKYGVSELLIEKIYKTMIDHFIDEEMKEWEKK